MSALILPNFFGGDLRRPHLKIKRQVQWQVPLYINLYSFSKIIFRC